MVKPAKPAPKKASGPARKAPAKRAAATVPKRATAIPTIIGIGASAGGLEALEQFFAQVPEKNAVAFVVIQHLDPTHKDILPELLQSATQLTVSQARNRMRVKPGCVYVIPPNKDMSILHGVLFLLDPVAPRGLRLPIDFFFRALAQDRNERAIGVILSGMGSDGTLGLRAIKENAGLTLVQTPANAKFDAMPRSAIDARVVDIVAPAEQLPEKIFAILKHAHSIAPAEPDLGAKTQGALEKIITLLRERTGNDFSLYKKNTLYRRVERRMELHQIDAIANYVRYLGENPQEQDLLFRELLIGVTSFFRDPAVWDYLRDQAIPELLARHPAGRVLRAWVPACSTGEEAYTLAIVFSEALEKLKPQARYVLQVFATDLDADAIEKARQAYYPASIAADVSAPRLKRYFSEETGGYRLNKEIREMVIFAPQNIITDPPFTKLDILTCRNLLIYFGPELQRKLIPLFHYSMSRHGLLLLGTSETISGFTTLFAPLENKLRIYRRCDHVLAFGDVNFPTRYLPGATEAAGLPEVSAPPLNLQTLVDQVLLQKFSPAAVLVNAGGDILYVNGRTGDYLEPAAGKANWNIHVMAREGLRFELTRALKQSLRQAEAVNVAGLKIALNGNIRTVNLTVQALDQPEALHGRVMIVFTDVAAAPVEKKRPGKAVAFTTHSKLLEALQQAREESQNLREEIQTSQEELVSTNEELQSANEELQSTNEELTTSKEEMQSLNEELQTVNVELQSRLESLSDVNNDMENLLNSNGIAIVCLDNKLHVRRFTNRATLLFKLIAGDVGRPLSDIVTSLDYPGLQRDAQQVLRTLVFTEKQIATRDGHWFRARIMPYRTQDNVIDGVAITLLDITEFKLLEAELRGAQGKPAKDGNEKT